MKSNRSGRYRQRVALYDIPESAADSYGQPSQARTLIGTYWAEVRPLRGNEQLNVRAVWPQASHIVSMRWLGSAIPATADNPAGWIVPSMVLNLGLNNSYLHIDFAENVENRNRMWQLTCQEKIGAIA